jgi:hypothetical protein
MTKHITPYIISAIELPPVNEVDAKTRAEWEANSEAFCDSYMSSPNVNRESVRAMMERVDAFAAVFDGFILEAFVTGNLDRARFRELHAEQGRLRHEFLVLIGADPDSDDLMERPVELIHS